MSQLMRRPAAAAALRPATDHVGRYHSDELLADWVIVQSGDSLRVRIGPLVEEPVVLTDAGAFAAGARLQFLEENGRVSGLTLTSRGARNFRLTRISP